MLAHIGDSRAYLVRDGVLTQITKDHTFVQNLVDEGRITPEEAQHHPQRSLVTRVLTGAPDDEPDLVVREGRVGDRYLICSDGLSDYVARDTIIEVLTSTADPGETADRLVALALRAGAPDNVTVVVADVVDIAHQPAPPTQPQVVGAAAARPTGTRPIPTTPAAKAAALTEEATRGSGDTDDDGVTLAEEGPRSRRGTVLRLAALLVVLAVVVAGGSYAVYAWSQQQYYLSEQDGVVTVFRGVDQTLGPISLSSPEFSTTIAVEDLPASYQDSLRQGIGVDDRAAADARVGDLRVQAQACRWAQLNGEAVPHRAVDLDDADPHADPHAQRLAERLPEPRSDELPGDLMSVVSSHTPRRGRNVELVLVIGAVAIVLLAYLNVELATTGEIPPGTLTLVGGYLGLAIGFHLVLRWRASYADPLMLPIITLLNGLGLVMIHRIDLAHGKSIADGVALRQLMWTAVAMVIAAVVLIVLRDHRVLRALHLPRGGHRFRPAAAAAAADHRHLDLRLADLDPDRTVLVPAR